MITPTADSEPELGLMVSCWGVILLLPNLQVCLAVYSLLFLATHIELHNLKYPKLDFYKNSRNTVNPLF